jgi:hypothetical protein
MSLEQSHEEPNDRSVRDSPEEDAARGVARKRRWGPRWTVAAVGIGLIAVLVAVSLAPTSQAVEPSEIIGEVQSLDGSGNNEANPEFGQAGNNYSRVADTREIP